MSALFGRARRAGFLLPARGLSDLEAHPRLSYQLYQLCDPTGSFGGAQRSPHQQARAAASTRSSWVPVLQAS